MDADMNMQRNIIDTEMSMQRSIMDTEMNMQRSIMDADMNMQIIMDADMSMYMRRIIPMCMSTVMMRHVNALPAHRKEKNYM